MPLTFFIKAIIYFSKIKHSLSTVEVRPRLNNKQSGGQSIFLKKNQNCNKSQNKYNTNVDKLKKIYQTNAFWY